MSKNEICAAVAAKEETLLKLSHDIHANPQLGFQETKAVAFIKEVLEAEGFEFICPWAGLETSFKAIYHGKLGGKTVAFLAEYDALAGLGHGCGHNLIATMAVGAAIGMKKQMADLAGDIVVLGCPAEEGGKGKVIMLDNGGFENIDYAMMIHTSDANMIQRKGLAACNVVVEYTGKEVHSKMPAKGINALTALIKFFVALDMQRQLWPDSGRCNGIITHGGTAPNIVPGYAAAKFTVRAATIAELKAMMEDMERLAKAEELAIGAKLTFTKGLISSERYPNLEMDLAFKANVATLGREMVMPPPDFPNGSSDFGNVSMTVPGIHAYLSIAPEGQELKGHTPEYVVASASPLADETVLLGSKALAMTAYDILTDEALRQRIAEEFARVPHN